VSQPPYHLRPNKAVDRFLLVEILKRLGKKYDLADYTYYGFGGPFLEDCRLLCEHLPEIRLVSIENDPEIYKRQKFHKFNRKLTLIEKDFQGFIAGHDLGEGKQIFWLDYTKCNFRCLQEFQVVIQRVSDYSVVRLTINADKIARLKIRANVEKYVKTSEWRNFVDNFNTEYGAVLPNRIDDPEYFYPGEKSLSLLCKMIRIAAERARPTNSGTVFQVLNASYYRDGATMLSVTGIICPIEKVADIRKHFTQLPFINLTWEPAHKIDMPILSTKERLNLERHLPTEHYNGRELLQVLGYNFDDDRKTTIEKLRQYAYFYKYYPQFARIAI